MPFGDKDRARQVLVGHARRMLTQVGSPAVHTQPGQEIE
ncbi:hypothetical protein OCO_43480 [Mycobacterium intracellulare MOTT-02]|nr:hypothetical protein OCO_43480 [Mycobacterium intracellulare MOTT-02]